MSKGMASRTPYGEQPPQAFWRRAVAQVPPGEVDPVGPIDLSITPATKVATAGSCFAQHIARRLQQSGFTYFVTEQKPPFLDEETGRLCNYGTFSARFGNLYTSRQLLQLVRRAYGEFAPVDDLWTEPDGSVLDPYRPTIQPYGYLSAEELHLDRAEHFRAVRRLVEECELFVFTLGLTECWINRADGAVYPLCPGAAGGTFEPDRHAFVNLGVAEVVADMRDFVAMLRARNPATDMLLTVSPVPLIATATPKHVLTATTYSKSVLRVAAEQLASELPRVFYFPSYEIITGSFARGQYYGEDCRDVTEAGVDHVMRLFFRHVAGFELGESAPAPAALELADIAAEVVKAICDKKSLSSLPGSRRLPPPKPTALDDPVDRDRHDGARDARCALLAPVGAESRCLRACGVA